jgi:four helix bundle protein
MRCRRFASDVISLCGKMSEKTGTRDIAGQVIRSAASIGANLEEARGSGTRVEYARFFRIALKSANETKYWLALIQDVGLAPRESLMHAVDEAQQIANMLGAAVLKLNAKSGKL